ncbi:MAG: hypothetical protein CL944_01540 [Candidatus Diapherotrites archaeon]|uniref:DUF4388 domain-containing protein n=1 Tax=Candidatus Iainarchaeum sp. TaxID=3101447 RepID=A0A2D6LPJ7_9ARCH|nr:hypothetical protein [Candidatus Diapherotrites archaeon]|tara:strand:- start:5513 stop:6007 length:495 start_codon:yes stop_codon:yes gene_type:complete
MNLPVGEVISQGVNFKEVDSKRLVQSLYEKNFSGYVIVAVEGYDGLEEGMLLFKQGKMVGAYHEYDLHGITVFGDDSITHVFNSFAAEYVVGDLVSLSNQQVDLVTAFNDKTKLEAPISKADIQKLIPKVYSSELAKNILSEVVQEKDNRKDVFKKLGLSGLGD